MKTIKQYILIAFSALTLPACTLLDTEPQDFITPDKFYNTQEELEAALRGVYMTLADNGLYGMNIPARLGLSADIGYETYDYDSSSVGFYDVSTNDAMVLTYWRLCYAGINRANKLLESIDRPAIDETVRARIESEARFLRAYFHFMLVNRFQNIPIMLKSPKDGYKESVQIAQSAPRDTYRMIISEMEASIAGLPDAETLSGGGHLSKSAAYGILARAALYMAGQPLEETSMYAKAKEYAGKVIELGFHRLNPSFEEVFINMIQDKYDIRETIFEIEFWGNNQSTYTATAGQIGRINGIQAYTALTKIGPSNGALRASSYFYTLYEEGDLRRDWTIAPFYYQNSENDKGIPLDYKHDCGTNYWRRCCGKFRREYELSDPKDNQYTPINFPVLRYSDVLLMWAEAVAADPDSSAQELDQAYEYVNMVRRRGFGKDPLIADATVDLEQENKQQLLENIKDERARELGFEALRKDDLVRWGELYDRMVAVRATIPPTYTSNYYVMGRIYYGNISRRDVVWPIPSYELGVNRKLVQNTGF